VVPGSIRLSAGLGITSGSWLDSQRSVLSEGRPLPNIMLQKRIDDQPSISPRWSVKRSRFCICHLKRVGLKHTAQRDTICAPFLETREHLSINELHRLVQKKDARIGSTTVYRTLKLLCRMRLGERSRIS